MSVSEISSSTCLNQVSSPQTNSKQLFQQLGQALKSGNLADAQQAFTALTQNAPNSGQTGQGQLSQDITTLGNALQSGDLTSAQDAFLKLQQDLKTAGHAHHHRHHKGMGDSQNAAAGITDAVSLNDGGDSQSTGKTIDVTT
jgi:hypothetical protein